MSGSTISASFPIWVSQTISKTPLAKRLAVILALAFFLVVLMIRVYSPFRFPNQYIAESASVPVKFSDVTDNATFGFPNVFLINIPTRFDYLDAATLQAFLSGVQFEVFPAVEGSTIKDKGMPPTSDKDRLRPAEKACWRSHANIWSQLLRGELPCVLILEADAAWDINIRTIMTNFHRHFTSFLRLLRSTPLPGLGRLPEKLGESTHHVFPDPSDPWHSKHWDILSLGHCSETDLNHELMLRYKDNHAPAGKSYYGSTLGHERVIRKSGGIACTTAYAISKSGAAKLLLRTAKDLDMPVDLVIKTMITAGELIAYSVQPTIMTQWKYIPGIGMNLRGANSDVQESEKDDADEDPSAWEKVGRTGSVWTPVEYFIDVGINTITMEEAWKRIYGGERVPVRPLATA